MRLRWEWQLVHQVRFAFRDDVAQLREVVGQQLIDRLCSRLTLALGLAGDLLGSAQCQCANQSGAPAPTVQMRTGAVDGSGKLWIEGQLDAWVRGGHDEKCTTRITTLGVSTARPNLCTTRNSTGWWRTAGPEPA
jgi:hypothetical protein